MLSHLQQRGQIGWRGRLQQGSVEVAFKVKKAFAATRNLVVSLVSHINSYAKQIMFVKVVVTSVKKHNIMLYINREKYTFLRYYTRLFLQYMII